MMTPAKMNEILSRLTHDAVEQALLDWEVQIGFVSKITEVRAHMLRGPEELSDTWNSEHYLRMTTQVEYAAAGTVQFFFSTESAWPLVRDALCLPPAEDRGVGDELGESEIEAFQEMMNMFCGSANAIYDRFGLRLSQSVEHLKVEQGEPGLPQDLHGFAISMQYEIEGQEPREIVQVMPFPLAWSVAKAIRSGAAA